MGGWHERPFASWDTETTSASPEEARIVTSALVVIDGGQVHAREWLINPGVDIPEQATAIHGVTTMHARAAGDDAANGCYEIATALHNVWSRGMPLVIFNATYDCTVLDRELRRHHGRGFEVRGPIIDPYIIDKALDRYRKGSRTLSAAVEHYHVTLTDAHSSLGDCLGAARVAWRLAQRYPRELADLTALHDRQIAWKAEQAASFRAYLIKRGEDASDVTDAWPVVPYVPTPACESVDA